MLKFHFSDTEQDAGDDTANRSAQIELLRDAHDADALLAPIRQDVDTVSLPPRKSIELPDNNRFHLAIEDSGL
ncbi:hypothetical protein MFFC18_13410 [Mariniblastus fucicola]|uniref:Uncharacterized protein n=1 Tax=Mariniblastus fucicola TaxID=980251 RepID=A0A5B9P8F2_9BACT|nr:hypothetical protein MFFC18_13410 [Mariniblastus fucicola]